MALAAVGVGGAFASSLAVLEPYRPLFVTLAVGALGVAFWRSASAGTASETVTAEGPDCACDDASRHRTRWVLLVGTTIAVAALVAAPALLSRDTPTSADAVVQPVSVETEREVVVRIEGMTCDACARGVEATLARTEGVLAASVGMTPPEARIRYDDTRTTSEALVEAVEALGYEVEVVVR
jgi:copper chaperone CopZ